MEQFEEVRIGPVKVVQDHDDRSFLARPSSTARAARNRLSDSSGGVSHRIRSDGAEEQLQAARQIVRLMRSDHSVRELLTARSVTASGVSSERPIRSCSALAIGKERQSLAICGAAAAQEQRLGCRLPNSAARRVFPAPGSAVTTRTLERCLSTAFLSARPSASS